MEFRKSNFNDLELQTDSVANKNRDPFSEVLPNNVVPNKDPLSDVLPNKKTTFRDQDTTVDENTGGYIMPGTTFAYGGDKGVNKG